MCHSDKDAWIWMLFGWTAVGIALQVHFSTLAVPLWLKCQTLTWTEQLYWKLIVASSWEPFGPAILKCWLKHLTRLVHSAISGVRHSWISFRYFLCIAFAFIQMRFQKECTYILNFLIYFKHNIATWRIILTKTPGDRCFLVGQQFVSLLALFSILAVPLWLKCPWLTWMMAAGWTLSKDDCCQLLGTVWSCYF